MFFLSMLIALAVAACDEFVSRLCWLETMRAPS
jgi:hypothetical protein